MATGFDYDEPSAADQSGSHREDLGYDPNFVPDSVKSFVVHLYRHIREKNVYEIHQMYETSFQTLSERLFKETPWPSVDAVAHYVDNDHVFCLLYREMWFRHLYARLSPTLKQRIDSWDNYCSLFQVVLHGVVNMQLPNQWLWDMVDEFVYQFQSFCQYRAKMKSKTEQEIALLRQHDQAWNVYGVLNFLQALVEKSMIIQILEQEKEGLEQFTATDGYDYSGGSNVLKVLGYFSMVGLLRVHCLLGDYHTGLKCLLPIDITQQGVYTSVIGSHITTIYHYGFANLMLRRYVDAIREFNKILLYIYKTKQYHQKSPQYEQILKKNEQMYGLLAICLSLCPQVKLVDETVNSQLREKDGEKMIRMQRYDDEAFAIYDELFSYACPKFITPSAPSFEEPLVNYNQDAYRLQLKLFLYEVKQQQLLSGVRTFLKGYSTISLTKLANFMEVDESTLRTILLTYKHKTHAVDAEGKIISNADVDFYIDDDMIHVVESKPVKRYGDYLLRQIVKLEGVINDMDRIFLIEKAEEMSKAYEKDILHGGTAYHSVEISWHPPEVEWVKINSDGASKGNLGLASTGGLIRDFSGSWLGGFLCNLGNCSATLAELWGVYYGLDLAWRKDFKKVIMEVDSQAVLKLLEGSDRSSHKYASLIEACKTLLKLNWEVKLIHTFREGNRVADWMANFAGTCSLGYHECDVQPADLQDLLLADICGSSSSRRVRL